MSTTRCLSMGHSSSPAEGKQPGTPCTSPWGSSPMDEGRSLGFVFPAEGESAQNNDLKRRRVQRVQIFITDDLPGLEEAIKKIFPEADWQLCVLHAVWDALNKA